MDITFQSGQPGRSLRVQTEGASVRFTLTQETSLAGLLMDPDTALAFAAAVAQAAKKVRS